MVALAALTCSCAKENIVNEGGPKPAASKVINTPENADAESILIYVADGVAGTGAIDSIAKEAGALACKPLFESYPGHEEDERRFGLDRWYKLDLEKGTSLEMVATALSSQKKIERVQYNTRMRNVVTRRPHPYVSNIQTKAVQNSNAAFNDPMLSKQWSYHNTGNGNTVCGPWTAAPFWWTAWTFPACASTSAPPCWAGCFRTP